MKHNQFTYHFKKGFPKDLDLPSKTYVLNYTKHAKQEALRDQHAEKINLPTFLNFSSRP